MYVELEYLKFRNVLSYGAKEVEHRVEPGLTMISGRNGTGKSTFLDVLCYNWYGKPYRKVKLEALINRRNGKGMDTETGIIVDKKDRYRILRGMKTRTQSYLKVFKNDTPFEMLSTRELNQDEITRILGIDYKMFKQIVSLAVSYNKPFLTQEAAEKREIVESIFNIKIFGSMLETLKKKISSEKVKYTVNKKTVEMLEENITLMRKNIIDVKKSIAEFEKNKTKDIATADRTLAVLATEISRGEDSIKELSSKLTSYAAKKLEYECSVTEKEAQLKTIMEDVSNPAIAEMIKEVEDIDRKIKECVDKIAALEKEEIKCEDDGQYCSFIKEQDTLTAEIKEKMNELHVHKDSQPAYTTDKTYSELLVRETAITITSITPLEKSLSDLLENTGMDKKLHLLSASRDALLKEQNDNEKTIKDETEYIEYLKTNTVCQKCKGTITEDFRAQETKKAGDSIITAKEVLVRVAAGLKEIKEKAVAISKLSADIETHKKELLKIQQDKKLRELCLDNEHKEKGTKIYDIINIKTQKLENVKTLISARTESIKNDKAKKISILQNEKSGLDLSRTKKDSAIDNLKKEKSRAVQKEVFDLKKEIEILKIKAENDSATMATINTGIANTKVQMEALEKSKLEISERKPVLDLPTLELEFKGKISAFQEAYKENSVMAENLKIYDISVNMLSEEGIKSFFFKRLTPILNAKINEYLDKFDIPIRVKFNEQMEEEIYNVEDDTETVSYFSYSEGEKKSIDTSILMSFIDITKTICNWTTNILIIDELIDGQVDAGRLELMMGCLKEFSGSGMIPSIYVITHRQSDEVVQYFKKILYVDKIDGFSEISVKRI